MIDILFSYGTQQFRQGWNVTASLLF